jgi:hypothetical protein
MVFLGYKSGTEGSQEATASHAMWCSMNIAMEMELARRKQRHGPCSGVRH